MSRSPIRTTLHVQLVMLLREGIADGRWMGEMPSEAELCRDFQVSRMTLRKALGQLAYEQVIELGGHGCRHQVRQMPVRREVSAARTVRVLTPFPVHEWGTTEHRMTEGLSARLETEGYRVVIEQHPGIFRKFQAAKLAHLDALPDTAAWVLLFANERMQQWFSRRDRPVILLGRAHEGISFSGLYPDSSAAGRHAAGLLCSRGHRELVYLIANLTSLGDRMCSEVFVDEARRLGARARIVSYEAEAEAVAKTMRDLIASRPTPTAFVSGSSDNAITVLCHLQSAGIRVPAQASVVAMWDDFALDCTFPVIARYRVDGNFYGRKGADMLLDLIRNGTALPRTHAIVPEYVAGGSVGTAG